MPRPAAALARRALARRALALLEWLLAPPPCPYCHQPLDPRHHCTWEDYS